MSLALRRADCGHLVPLEMEPNVSIHTEPYGQRPGWACIACLEAAQSHQRPRIERKVEIRDAAPAREEPVDWAERGREAAQSGAERTLPVELRGEHARSAKSRAWFAGWDEEQTNGDGKRTDGAEQGRQGQAGHAPLA